MDFRKSMKTTLIFILKIKKKDNFIFELDIFQLKKNDIISKYSYHLSVHCNNK